MSMGRLEKCYKEHFEVASDQSSTMLRMCVIVTTADCESEFSELKPFKAPLRNCIGQENLNLAMQLSVKSGGVLDVLDFKNTKKKFC